MCCREGAFGGGTRAFAPPSKADASTAAELDGLPRFEKNFYVESPGVAGMTEDEARAKEINAYLQSNARQNDSQSGARAKYRHLGGTMLLQEMTYRN